MSNRKTKGSVKRPRTILIITPSALFNEAFALWCQRYVDSEYVDWADSLEHGREQCFSFRPALLIVDPSTQHNSINESVALLRQELTDHLLLLDARPLEANLVAILKEPQTSYFSRMASSHSLAKGISEIMLGGRRIFDPAFAARLQRTDRGYQLDDAGDERSISLLTQREKEVMRLLAQGYTVKQVGEMLKITESTVENHKSRLMKKLGVHKSAELALHAVRCGLITA